MNPRAAINDLHPFQGCPFSLLGTSPKISNQISSDIQLSAIPVDLSAFSVSYSGEDGIRTHAPFRTNGFQDRLVMTTSIPLQVSIYALKFTLPTAEPLKRKTDCNKESPCCQPKSNKFFSEEPLPPPCLPVWLF